MTTENLNIIEGVRPQEDIDAETAEVLNGADIFMSEIPEKEWPLISDEEETLEEELDELEEEEKTCDPDVRHILGLDPYTL